MHLSQPVDAQKVYLGGPDQPARALRDLLERRIDAVPIGGSIDWATYYFRDEQLAEALVRAHERGVAVRICLEGRPRQAHANDAVVRILTKIGPGLCVSRDPFTRYLHTKLYCFSHPQPAALVGSFNPSGNQPEDAAMVAHIGDHDRGHNLLVQLTNPSMVNALIAHVRGLGRRG